MNRLKRKVKRGKKTGLINVALLVVAIMSGYLIQLITHETALTVVSNLHIYVSILCILMVLIHQLISDKKKKKNVKNK